MGLPMTPTAYQCHYHSVTALYLTITVSLYHRISQSLRIYILAYRQLWLAQPLSVYEQPLSTDQTKQKNKQMSKMADEVELVGHVRLSPRSTLSSNHLKNNHLDPHLDQNHESLLSSQKNTWTGRWLREAPPKKLQPLFHSCFVEKYKTRAS